ncbi:MAG: carbohydrate biosynthesis protein [Desulfamplus sp.]|nr:carbohydrate biosynthesis protein [Desulfamplus sp.]
MKDINCNKRTNVFIWDQDDDPPHGNGNTILWRNYGAKTRKDVFSIPHYIENRSDQLKTRYLAWIHELGEATINDRRLVDHLELRPGFSFWWMTLLVEKNYTKSSGMYDAFRLLALEELTASFSFNKIILVSGNSKLAKVIENWCSSLKADFEWRKEKQSNLPLKKRIWYLLPYWMRAVLTFGFYLREHASFRDTEISKKEGGLLVDYLIHLEKASWEGRYVSNFWNKLPQLLGKDAAVNWLHHFVPHPAIPFPIDAKQLVRSFNETEKQQKHFFLGSGLGWKIVWRMLRDYFKLQSIKRKLDVESFFKPVGSKMNFWPLFKHDWFDSMSGLTAVSNILFLNLFESLLKTLPKQKMGFYLLENQAWERAFIYAWRTWGHGTLIGVQHATVRYWDLRYFADPQSYARINQNDMPLPDKVALNGKAAVDAYRNGKYPESQLIEVEALRYLNLLKRDHTDKNKNKKKGEPIRILVLTDYLVQLTRQQMQWLEIANSILDDEVSCIVKPHPACPVEESDYPSFSFQITNSPIDELLAECDIAYTSNVTSAAVNAYVCGIPVISVLDGNTFNMSPLRGLNGVYFASSPQSVVDAVRKIQLDPEMNIRAEYFTLDPDLPRWRRLINQIEHSDSSQRNVI